VFVLKCKILKCLAWMVPIAVSSKIAEIVGLNPKCIMNVCCDHSVLLGRGLCSELVTHPEGLSTVVRRV
jgi:hypothetical protein